MIYSDSCLLVHLVESRTRADVVRARTRAAKGITVCERAARLRATHRLGTPDARHLAAALEHGCDELWTNDDRLSRAVGDFARVVGR